MTMPYEECSAIIRAEALLLAIAAGQGIGKGTKKELREAAQKTLRHYPGPASTASKYADVPIGEGQRTFEMWRNHYQPGWNQIQPPKRRAAK